jgi:hypothetical protein
MLWVEERENRILRLFAIKKNLKINHLGRDKNNFSVNLKRYR